MEIRDLKGIDFDTIFRAFEQAFADYDIRFEKEEVRAMLKRRGFNPELSFAAFDNGAIVAFTLNGTGTYGNTPTAYDTGTGTLAAYRGRGLAREIFSHSVPYLKKAGIEQYLLEVLQNNDKAIGVYRRAGFLTTREFDCFRQRREEMVDDAGSGYNPPIEIRAVANSDILACSDFCDFRPSWQNDMDSIERAGDDLCRLGALLSGELVGYCIFDPKTGDLSQIAVGRQYRRRRIDSRLLQAALEQMDSPAVKVLNIDPDGRSLSAFLESKNMLLRGRQFEMILPLK